MNCRINVDSLHTNYYYPELKFWSDTLRLSNSDDQLTNSQHAQRMSQSRNVQKELWKGPLTVFVEFSDCSVGPYLQPPEQFQDLAAAKVVLASATSNLELSPLQNDQNGSRQIK